MFDNQQPIFLDHFNLNIELLSLNSLAVVVQELIDFVAIYQSPPEDESIRVLMSEEGCVSLSRLEIRFLSVLADSKYTFETTMNVAQQVETEIDDWRQLASRCICPMGWSGLDLWVSKYGDLWYPPDWNKRIQILMGRVRNRIDLIEKTVAKCLAEMNSKLPVVIEELIPIEFRELTKHWREFVAQSEASGRRAMFKTFHSWLKSNGIYLAPKEVEAFKRWKNDFRPNRERKPS